MTFQFDSIKYSIEETIATIIISRPANRNAWNEGLRCEIVDALGLASRDPKVRVVIITGDPAGKAFCAGADLAGGKMGGENAAKNYVDVPEGRKMDGSTFRDGGGVAALSVLRCTKPVIAAINGAAVGVGMTLPLSCDIRVAAHDAKVGFVFARRGLSCETISSLMLPKIVGMGPAMELVLTGRVFKTQDAPAGLFNYVVPADQVMAKAKELAREIAENTSAMSVVLSRWALLRNANMSIEEAHLAESKLIHFMAASPDNKEGMLSFLEKRSPNFKMDPYKDLPDFFPWWSQIDTTSKL
mmetsp:Transcript_22541/g.42208  ORF Transcript_22541/g.42208 Transcript_22541/m.42208 type:complete len:299 (+) Transcript_22541:307-1203(+)